MRNITNRPTMNVIRRALWPLHDPTRQLGRILGAFAVAWLGVAMSADADEPPFPQEIGPRLVRYCNDCHDADTSEGGLNLDSLGTDLADATTFDDWQKVFDRVASGEMPPNDASPFEPEHLVQFKNALGGALTEAHVAVKGTVLRRLNRREYENTMNDLFGTHLDLASLLPEDGRSHEFDNVGQSLSVSVVQLQQYLDAVDTVMDAAIARTVEKPVTEVKRANYAETSEGEKHIGSAWKQAEDGAVVFFRELGYPTGMLRTANVREPGRYKIRVKGYAYQSSEPITFAIGATTFQRGAERPTFAYHSMPRGDPSIVEVEAWIEKNYMIELTPWGISDDENEIRKNGIENYPGPGLAILEVELEGPIVDEFPSRGHRLLLDGLDRREIEPSNPAQKMKSWYVPKFEVVSSDPKRDAATVLRRIATTAFRRPVSQQEVDPFVELFESQLAGGATIEEAIRTSVAAIFCSPDFLYLRENDGWLDDHAIASRLSYFLTRSTPDRELLAAAESGSLSKDPGVLLSQTKRLLDDPRHRRFVVEFTDAWLNLRDIEFTSPDKNLFPEFDAFLQHSMLKETREFLARLIEQNLPVRNLIKSDFAMLNNRLAQHYEIDGVATPEIKLVSLPKDSVRGGLLAQASVLKVSANGTNTSPVMRGIYVLERFIGKTPPPPPAGVAGVEPDVRGATTLRELLEKHRDLDSCRNCHLMIDPPGFALESFDPIGGWRERFRSLGDGDRVDLVVDGRKVRYRLGPEVDASGELPGGKTFAGYEEFRDLLAENEDLLVRTLAKKFLTFATGRELGFSDRPQIEKIVKQSKSKGHGVRDLIELVVLSEAFRRK